MEPHQLELLAPARDADIGIEAVNHGADAVYIGGPSFGARAAASNEVTDIARLVEYAHRFNARVFVTLNTILPTTNWNRRGGRSCNCTTPAPMR